MATNPVTYRISPDVDAELKALAEKHGGVDKALRVLLEAHKDLDLWKPIAIGAVKAHDAAIASNPRFKGPILKPKDRK